MQFVRIKFHKWTEMSVPLSSIQYFLLSIEHLQCKFRFKKVESDTSPNKEHLKCLFAELWMESSWAVNMNEEGDMCGMDRIVFVNS